MIRCGAFSNAANRASKKSILPSEQERPDIARRRFWWRKYQGRIDINRLVFIDETWIKTNMTRLRGWCRKGQRLAVKLPHGHGEAGWAKRGRRPLRYHEFNYQNPVIPTYVAIGFTHLFEFFQNVAGKRPRPRKRERASLRAPRSGWQDPLRNAVGR